MYVLGTLYQVQVTDEFSVSDYILVSWQNRDVSSSTEAHTWLTLPGMPGMSALPPGTIGRTIRCCCGAIPLSDGWAAVPAMPGGAGPTVPFWFNVPKILPVLGSINSRTACPPLGTLFTTVAGDALIGEVDDGIVEVSVTLKEEMIRDMGSEYSGLSSDITQKQRGTGKIANFQFHDRARISTGMIECIWQPLEVMATFL